MIELYESMIITNEIKNNDNSVINPKRVICLVPSLTELLHYLGLENEVVGITKFCIHPEVWFKHKKRVGGTKKIHRNIVESLSPDLIIANKEENTREDLVGWTDVIVWVTDIKIMNDLFLVIQSMGILFDRKKQANQLIERIHRKQIRFQKASLLTHKPKILYLIWWDPIMTVGGDTFIHHMIEEAGFTNITKDQERYPVLSLERIIKYAPDYIFLSSEPFPFKERHKDILQKELPKTEIHNVDGEMFSWYGSRVCQAFDYFEKELIPNIKHS